MGTRLRRLAALPVIIAILAVLATGCEPSAPPTVFVPASCPVGQHPTDAGCVR